MRHSEYYERPVDGADAGDVWMGERRLNQLYGGGDFFVGPQHSERVFQVKSRVNILYYSCIYICRSEILIHPRFCRLA